MLGGAAWAGVACLLVAAGLTGIGLYDGVLLQSVLDPLPETDRPVEVLLRIRLDAGTATPPAVAEELMVASALGVAGSDVLGDARPVTVRVDGDGAENRPVVALFPGGDLPPTGNAIVAHGTLVVTPVTVDTGDGVVVTIEVLVLSVETWHEPVLFR